MNLAQTIKKAATEAVNASMPADIIIGVVSSLSPFEVATEKMAIDEDFIIRTDAVAAFEIGDTAVLLQAGGGQKFVVLGKVIG
ncbi:DUF2577 family protein [Fusibacter paucivorans]|uniref:DUF2577 family protein n=1 Tax=Fusibacter paucivorans TaxID=76009 RepID=A0ABS5PRP6_9FIRM|nr:DUF2577 family protein [Fusibacter paucivorans]MBS7527844.1 DUF2577 family protein [Fusibacter paucivorans]